MHVRKHERTHAHTHARTNAREHARPHARMHLKDSRSNRQICLNLYRGHTHIYIMYAYPHTHTNTQKHLLSLLCRFFHIVVDAIDNTALIYNENSELFEDCLQIANGLRHLLYFLLAVLRRYFHLYMCVCVCVCVFVCVCACVCVCV